jgi:hypothetical protein
MKSLHRFFSNATLAALLTFAVPAVVLATLTATVSRLVV